MSYVCIQTRAQIGLDSPSVCVEVHLANGLPCFHIVGLPEMAVRESRERVRAAIINSHFQFPSKRITVNLAPAELPKQGGRFDLAIAIGLLLASEQIRSQQIQEYEFIGELSLSGKLLRSHAVLPSAHQCANHGNILITAWANQSELQLLASQHYLLAHDLFIDFNGGLNIGTPAPDEPDNNLDDNHIIPDADPGESITETYELDPATNQVVIEESLGSSDDKDFYAFTLDNSAEVSFSLTDLDADVDLILKNSQGRTIVHEWKWGNQDLDITELLEAGETYYIVTDSWDRQDTDYTLSINFNGGYNIDESTSTPTPENPENPENPITPNPSTPPGYAGINIANAVDYFQDNYQDYAVV